MEKELPWVLDDLAYAAAAQGCAQCGQTPEIGGTGGISTWAGAVAQEDDRHPCAEIEGMGKLLQACGNTRRFRGDGWIPAAKAAVHSLETMETPVYTSKKTDAERTWGGAGLAIGHERPGSLVELRGVTYEPSIPQEIL